MIPGIIESARSVVPFTDTFNRANNANIATIEYEWIEVRGDWQISSNTAFTPTTASSYPLAVFDSQKSDGSFRATSSGSDNAGFGVSFWVRNANNWWAAVTQSVTTGGTSSAYTCPEGGTLSGTTCLRTCTSSTTTFSGGTCPNNQSVTPNSQCICNDPGGCACSGDPVDPATCTCYSGFLGFTDSMVPSCGAIGGYAFNGVCYQNIRSGAVNPYSYPGSGCTANTTTTSFNCDYPATLTTVNTTVYTHTMRIIKSESGVVSEVASSTFSNTGSDNYLSTIQVSTNINSITVTGVRGGSSVSFNHTANNPQFGTQHGIIIAPATRGQSTRIDQFEYIN